MNGFLPGDLTYVPENTEPFDRFSHPRLSLEERLHAPQATPEMIEEAKEVYDFIDRSTWFDGIMDIERPAEAPASHGRNSILWAARRHLHGVKLPSKTQLVAMARAL